MSWDDVHRRYELTNRVLASVERTEDATAIEDWDDEIVAVFGDVGRFLLHLEHRWFVEFETRLDSAIERSGAATRSQVAEVWAQMVLAKPAAARVLQTYADHPTLRGRGRRHPFFRTPQAVGV